MTVSRFIVLLGVLASVLATAQECRAQESRLAGARWTYAVPEGWEAMEPATLEEFNALIRGRVPRAGPGYAAGIRMVDAPQVYALLQLFDDPRLGQGDFDSIERAFGAQTMERSTSDARGAFGDLLAKIELGRPTLDRQRRRIIMTTRLTGTDGVEVQGLSQGLLWAGGIVNIHTYAPASEFQERLPSLLLVADSVRFDPGQEFVPRSGGIDWGQVLRTVIVCGLIGAVLGGLGSIARRKSANSPLAK